MSTLPNCPKCNSDLTYEYQDLFTCPECAHEWTATDSEESTLIVKDANGTVLQDGDTVTLIKDLKLKGSSTTIKVGTKVKGIRLVEGDHDIDCKVPGVGATMLKSQFVKKVQIRLFLKRQKTKSPDFRLGFSMVGRIGFEPMTN